jgi:hypothetical protein
MAPSVSVRLLRLTFVGELGPRPVLNVPVPCSTTGGVNAVVCWFAGLLVGWLQAGWFVSWGVVGWRQRADTGAGFTDHDKVITKLMLSAGRRCCVAAGYEVHAPAKACAGLYRSLFAAAEDLGLP